MVNKKLIISSIVGIIVTFFVYLGLQDSLNHPSFTHLPIAPDVAVKMLTRSVNSSEGNFKVINYVYVKPDGSLYKSNIEHNSVNELIGHVDPTDTSASHFAWEIEDKNSHKLYYIDHLTGEIISSNSSTKK